MVILWGSLSFGHKKHPMGHRMFGGWGIYGAGSVVFCGELCGEVGDLGALIVDEDSEFVEADV